MLSDVFPFKRGPLGVWGLSFFLILNLSKFKSDLRGENLWVRTGRQKYQYPKILASKFGILFHDDLGRKVKFMSKRRHKKQTFSKMNANSICYTPQVARFRALLDTKRRCCIWGRSNVPYKTSLHATRMRGQIHTLPTHQGFFQRAQSVPKILARKHHFLARSAQRSVSGKTRA